MDIRRLYNLEKHKLKFTKKNKIGMILQHVRRHSRVHKPFNLPDEDTDEVKRVSTENQTRSTEYFATQIFLVLSINSTRNYDWL